MKFRTKPKVTVIDIIAGLFLLGFMLVFGKIAWGAEQPKTWEEKLTIEIIQAYDEYAEDINSDPTDLGCQFAKDEYRQRINSILSSYKNIILNQFDNETELSQE